MALQSLGVITVTTAGTPVRVASTITKCQTISVQQLSTNTGKIFIGAAGMDKSTLEGVYAVLPAISASSIPSATFSIPLSPAGLNAADVWLDADNDGEGGLVVISIQ